MDQFAVMTTKIKYSLSQFSEAIVGCVHDDYGLFEPYSRSKNSPDARGLKFQVSQRIKYHIAPTVLKYSNNYSSEYYNNRSYFYSLYDCNTLQSKGPNCF